MNGENLFAIIVLVLALVTLGVLVFNDDGCKSEEQVMMEEAERVIEN